jgi:hypothetical protein
VVELLQNWNISAVQLMVSLAVVVDNVGGFRGSRGTVPTIKDVNVYLFALGYDMMSEVANAFSQRQLLVKQRNEVAAADRSACLWKREVIGEYLSA